MPNSQDFDVLINSDKFMKSFDNFSKFRREFRENKNQEDSYDIYDMIKFSNNSIRIIKKPKRRSTLLPNQNKGISQNSNRVKIFD